MRSEKENCQVTLPLALPSPLTATPIRDRRERVIVGSGDDSQLAK